MTAVSPMVLLLLFAAAVVAAVTVRRVLAIARERERGSAGGARSRADLR